MALSDAAKALGLPVFPCDAQKRPVTDTGFKAATTDPTLIEQMFARAGAKLIGVPTGEVTGLVVIDVDVRHGPQGMAWLDANKHRLPETRTHHTQSGGLHLLFQYPAGFAIGCSQSRIAADVDVRANGGYICAPPSPGYTVADDTAPAPMPAWLIQACIRPDPPPPPPQYTPPPRIGEDRYGRAALDRECETVRNAAPGTQEGTLNAAALKMGALVAGGEIGASEVREALIAAGLAMQNEPGREPWTYALIETKVRRGMDDGAARPRQAPPRADLMRSTAPEPAPIEDPAYWAAVEADAAMSPADWHEMERRESGASTPAKEVKIPLLWTLRGAWQEADIPARPWIAKGYLLRRAVTVLSGPGSAGKSSIVVAWSACLALGCSFGRFQIDRPYRILVYNVEDDREEQMRRFSAMAQRLDVPIAQIMQNVLIVGPEKVGTLLTMSPDGRILLNTPVMDQLSELISEFQPDVIFLDPFVELHAQEENDNTAIRSVMARFRSMAVEGNMSVTILHHSRKGMGDPGDPDSLRGASSIVGAARVVLTLNVMTDQEAESLGVATSIRRNYFRMDGAKNNYAPLEEAEWFQRESRQLANDDSVAVGWPWQPPNIWHAHTGADLNLCLDEIEEGTPDGALYSPSRKGRANHRWVGNVLMRRLGIQEEQAARTIAQWLQTGLLYEAMCKVDRKDRLGVKVDNSKRPNP